MLERRRIDVHHHPSPPSYISARSREIHAPQAQWTIEKSLDDMDKGAVATSMLSVPHPVSIWPDDVRQGRSLARGWNEYMKKLCDDHPGRFGLFAALPILDIDGSLKEIEHALDTLGAEGICLMTNIGDKWLGDPHYAPVFEELDRRSALVYTHPVAPACCHNLLPEFYDSVIEFGTDTTRAIAKLLFSGAAARFPRIRFVFSHAGGTMPFLAERFMRAHLSSNQDLKARVPHGVERELQRFHYDTAQAAHPWAMASLTRLVSVSQILFGTDFPYRGAEETAQGLAQCGFSAHELLAIERGNALRLMPGLTNYLVR